MPVAHTHDDELYAKDDLGRLCAVPWRCATRNAAAVVAAAAALIRFNGTHFLPRVARHNGSSIAGKPGGGLGTATVDRGAKVGNIDGTLVCCVEIDNGLRVGVGTGVGADVGADVGAGQLTTIPGKTRRKPYALSYVRDFNLA